MADGTEAIDPNEIVYRRILSKGNHYKPGRVPPLSQKAFSPRDIDADGISLIRGAYVQSPQDAAALGLAGYDYWIIEMRAGDLVNAGMPIAPDPQPGCPGHALIP